MAAKSCRKGKVGERELAHLLTAHGFPATRGAQHKGSRDSPDVVCPLLDGLHFEVKRCERLELYAAIEQAAHDGVGKVPVVAHRRNGEEWLAVLKLKDLLFFMAGVQASFRSQSVQITTPASSVPSR